MSNEARQPQRTPEEIQNNLEEYRREQRERYLRQTGQAPRNIVQNTRTEPVINRASQNTDNGVIRRAEGTATTTNRQIDYSTQIPSNSSNNNNIPNLDQTQQLAEDEEFARRLQREELLAAQREEREQEQSSAPFRYNTGFFHPSTRQGLRDSPLDDDDEDEDYEVLPYSRQEMYETDDPEDLIRNIFPPIRTIVPQETHPVNQFLRNLLQSARTGQDLRNLPRQRIVFPQQFFQLQGFDSVPPHLREMLHGDSEASYERLLELSEALQPVSRGADPERIESLPSRQFHENKSSDPAIAQQQQEQQSSSSTTCNICLDDFKEKEVVTTLPQCLHSFHKTCISKWLAINKICPVCRADITEAQHA